MKASIEIKTVTPKEAEEMLSNLWPQQRQRREQYIDRLAKEMISGKWKMSGDAIILVKGMVGNGQHRLSAVVRSGVPCQFIVMESNDEDLFSVIDAVMRRTEADVTGVKNGVNIAAASRLILAYEKRMFASVNSSISGCTTCLSRSDVIDFIVNNDAKLQAIHSQVRLFGKKQNLLPLTIGSLIMWIFKSNPKAIEFLKEVYGGNGSSSAIDLRERIIRNKLSKSKLPGNYILALTLKACRSYMNGVRPGVLKVTDGEEFPYITN